MAYSETFPKLNTILQEASPTFFELEHSFSQPKLSEPQVFTLLLALIGKITILGFAVAWGLALLESI